MSLLIPIELSQQIRPELRADEKLVWAGQPRQGLRWGPAIIPMLFGIPWTIFAVKWDLIAVKSTHGQFGFVWLMPLFGVPFVVMGFMMVTSPYWMMREARRTIYAITTRRAIVFAPKFWGRLKCYSYLPDRLVLLERRERNNGSGDLIFETFTESIGSGTRTVRRGFMTLENLAEVEDVLRKTLLPATRGIRGSS